MDRRHQQLQQALLSALSIHLCNHFLLVSDAAIPRAHTSSHGRSFRDI